MDKGNFQVAGCGVFAGQDAIQQPGLLRLGGFVADTHGVSLLQGQHIVPQGVELLAQLIGAELGKLLFGVNAQQQQQYVAHCAAQFCAAVGQKSLFNPVVKG